MEFFLNDNQGVYISLDTHVHNSRLAKLGIDLSFTIVLNTSTGANVFFSCPGIQQK